MRLKRINACLPASSVRVYADYKGKGRYLPPEEVHRTEFEIDPKRNEGVSTLLTMSSAGESSGGQCTAATVRVAEM